MQIKGSSLFILNKGREKFLYKKEFFDNDRRKSMENGMTQIGVALLSSFQSMQKDAIDPGKTMTRNQRV